VAPQKDVAVPSILRTASSSLEPRDIRNRAALRSNSTTPRKPKVVKFDISGDQCFGGRGRTEFTKTPTRKSHTKKALPIGIFDTDSDGDSARNSHSAADPAPIHKLMASSRLFKVVRSKRRRKEKEQQWLSMISPQSAYSKTATRTVPRGDALPSNRSEQPLQSPSRCMSRGRRALLKAQHEIKRTPTKTKRAPPTPSVKVKGTPLVTAVNRIVSRIHHQQSPQRLQSIPNMQSLQELSGGAAEDGDIDDDIDDDVEMEMDGTDGMGASPPLGDENNGSIPPRSPESDRPALCERKETDAAAQNIFAADPGSFDYGGFRLSPLSRERTAEKTNRRNSFTLNVPAVFRAAMADDDDDDDDLDPRRARRASTSDLEAAFVARNLMRIRDPNEVERKDSAEPLDAEPATPSESEPEPLLRFPSASPSIEYPPAGHGEDRLLCIPERPSPPPSAQSIGVQVDVQVDSAPMPSRNAMVWPRSIGTQTDWVAVSIAVQTEESSMAMASRSTKQGVSATDGPVVIVTASGAKYIKLVEPETDANSNGDSKRNAAPKQQSERKEEEDAVGISSVDTEQMESLSLSDGVQNDTITALRPRSRLKRKFDSISPDRDDVAAEEKTPGDHGKRRRVNGRRARFHKKDVVWAAFEGDPDPVIIISVRFEGTEKWYPSQYEVLWLRWIDSSDHNNREGLCSVTVEAADKIIGAITDSEFAALVPQFNGAAKAEIKRWRPDIYSKHWARSDRRRSTKPNKIRRRMSVL